MKKLVSLMLLAAMCLTLAACSSGAKAPAPTPAPTAAPTPAPTPEPTPTPVPFDLEAYVAKLNAEQDAQQGPNDPILVHYDVLGDKILYKLTFDVLDIFALMAEYGDQGALDAYNGVMADLPGLLKDVQQQVDTDAPGTKVILRMTTDENFNHTIAACEDGVITYDRVNKIGTVPEDDAPVEPLPPEVQAQVDQIVQNIFAQMDAESN